MRTPTPDQLATHLDHLAKRLRNDGTRALDASHDYAARGYPNATLGDGGSRGNAELTTTEAASQRTDRTDLEASELRTTLQLLEQAALRAERLITSILGHADPNSATRTTHGAGPAGSGFCACCGRHVPGTDTNRLRAGWCNTCRRAWARAGRPDRGLFMQQQQRKLSSIDGNTTKPQVSDHA